MGIWSLVDGCILPLGRRRQNCEAEASLGYIPVSKRQERKTNKEGNVCLSCCLGAPRRKWTMTQR